MKIELTEYTRTCPLCEQEVPLAEISGLAVRGFVFVKHCELGIRCEASGKLTEPGLEKKQSALFPGTVLGRILKI